MTGSIHSATLAGLILTPLLIAAGQLLFKLTSARAGNFDVTGLWRLLTDPLMITALAVYGVGTIVWIYVLKSVPLTMAYSFMALTFCFVPILAVAFLGEAVTLRFGLGTALIIAGMLVIHL